MHDGAGIRASRLGRNRVDRARPGSVRGGHVRLEPLPRSATVLAYHPVALEEGEDDALTRARSRGRDAAGGMRVGTFLV